MSRRLSWVALIIFLAFLAHGAVEDPLDVAPFGLPLRGGNGVYWEDPREIHRVVVQFEKPVTNLSQLRLEYWGSRWPEQHLPKNREPGGGDVGWMELGNWFNGGWRVADTKTKLNGNFVEFTFNPVNAKEFPSLTKYAAAFRYTLKLRIAPTNSLPAIKAIQAFTDSELSQRNVHISFERSPGKVQFTAFNGIVERAEKQNSKNYLLSLRVATNSDPNTFDRTLITVHAAKTFTFAVDDLKSGPLFIPSLGAAVFAEDDQRDFRTLAKKYKALHPMVLYDRVASLPEQTWSAAWSNMPPKKSSIYLPLALDGGRHKFRLDANGGVLWRCNDNFLEARPGKDTPRLPLEKPYGRFEFSLSSRPTTRTIEGDSMPICHASWLNGGLTVDQTAFVTRLDGQSKNDEVPPADTCGVCLIKFSLRNPSSSNLNYRFPIILKYSESPTPIALDALGIISNGKNIRGQLIATNAVVDNGGITCVGTLAANQSTDIVLKIPYVVLTKPAELTQLQQLDFDREYSYITSYWRKRINESSRLITPEPVLNDFYSAHAGHLLINCEREPESSRRFARVGSFSYGAYGNESCMMVVDLDRRGYHREAEECLDGWLHYQSTVPLPGSFASNKGVLYGAGGYEMGGYNQHHGWILWMLGEHFRFTRDTNWLQRVSTGIVDASDWIINETRRTTNRHELEQGLLPAGSLEDIGDWWTWLSTSCYTWRGLDSAAWALEQIKHRDAVRTRKAADDYRRSLLNNFRHAAERSPVVRLRDGTAVPHFPSHVHRRGRSFGWICETLEGAMHLLITGVLDPKSPEAQWILNDYEDNLYLSNQYGYVLDDFDRWWFSRGGMSMQACLLLDAEPYIYRDDVKHALRAIFNALAVSHFPDVHMNTEHALPEMGDWRGDHYKSSDEANACGWLRYLFVRESGDDLLIGQAIPRDWLRDGQRCGIERAETYYGTTSVLYESSADSITAHVEAPKRNPAKTIHVRFRTPDSSPLRDVTVNGKQWHRLHHDWVDLPGEMKTADINVRF